MLIASLSCVERAASQTFPSVYGRIKRLKRGNLKETQDNEGPVMIHVSGHITPRIQPEDAVTFLTPIKKKCLLSTELCQVWSRRGDPLRAPLFFCFLCLLVRFSSESIGSGPRGCRFVFSFLARPLLLNFCLSRCLVGFLSIRRERRDNLWARCQTQGRHAVFPGPRGICKQAMHGQTVLASWTDSRWGDAVSWSLGRLMHPRRRVWTVVVGGISTSDISRSVKRPSPL